MAVAKRKQTDMKEARDICLDFLLYIENNPDQRFWQALRNWSGASFIYRQDEGNFVTSAIDVNGKHVKIIDTFND